MVATYQERAGKEFTAGELEFAKSVCCLKLICIVKVGYSKWVDRCVCVCVHVCIVYVCACVCMYMCVRVCVCVCDLFFCVDWNSC